MPVKIKPEFEAAVAVVDGAVGRSGALIYETTEADRRLAEIPEFNHELGDPIDLDPEVSLGASHGSAEMPKPTSKGTVGYYALSHVFRNRNIQLNFTDHATYGTEEHPGVVRHFGSDRLLVDPPLPRMAIDSNRDSSRLLEEGIDVSDPNKANARNTDFENLPVWARGGKPSRETREMWLTGERGPQFYHRELKRRFREKLENSNKPQCFYDFHGTRGWLYEDAKTMRTRTFELTDEDGNRIGVARGFPLAAVGDRYGAATAGFPDFAENLVRHLRDGFKLVGINPGEHRKDKPKQHIVTTEDGELDHVEIDDSEMVDHQVWGDVLANNPYQGAEVVRLLGIELREELIHEAEQATADGDYELAKKRQDMADRIYVCQVELDDSLILNEPDQSINPEMAYIFAMVTGYAMNRTTRDVVKHYHEAKS